MVSLIVAYTIAGNLACQRKNRHERIAVTCSVQREIGFSEFERALLGLRSIDLLETLPRISDGTDEPSRELPGVSLFPTTLAGS